MEQVLPLTRTSIIATLDYGSGSLRSAERVVIITGAEVTVTADPKTVMEVDGLLTPGVGAYAVCMEGLHRVQEPRLTGSRLAGGRPVIGIYVGMQMLPDRGVEYADGIRAAGTDVSATAIGILGCGEWPGIAGRLEASILPYMGWNTVEALEGPKVFRGLEDRRFYLARSYGACEWDLNADSRIVPPPVMWSVHGSDRFIAAMESGPLWAIQFCPEKSGKAGLKLPQNWVDTLQLSSRQHLP